MTQHLPGTGRTIPLASLPNLRDLGGIPAGQAITARGQVYRSTALDRITDPDLYRLTGLGLRTVVDLRSQGERERFPDRLPDGVTYLTRDVLADANGTDPAILGRIMTDPLGTGSLLANGRSQQFMITAYEDIVRLPSARASYRDLLTTFADPASGPLLFHCTTGKDRTGWAAAILLLIAGATLDDVMADYLQTNVDLGPAVAPILDRYGQLGGDPESLRPLLSVQAEFLDAALTAMAADFGDLSGYLNVGLGLTDDQVAAVRDRMLA